MLRFIVSVVGILRDLKGFATLNLTLFNVRCFIKQNGSNNAFYGDLLSCHDGL